jgi:hypothetical protein
MSTLHVASLTSLLTPELRAAVIAAHVRKTTAKTRMLELETSMAAATRAIYTSREFVCIQASENHTTAERARRLDVLHKHVAVAQQQLDAARATLETDREVRQLTERLAGLAVSRTRCMEATLGDARSAQSDAQAESVTAEADLAVLLAQVKLAYNDSVEAVTDSTGSGGKTARANSLSCHTVGDLMLKAGKIKAGGITKGAAELWFQQRFAATWQEEFTSFWCHNKPRDVEVVLSEAKATALGLSDSHVVSPAADRAPPVDTSGASTARKRPRTAAELRAVVWSNTMGEAEEGVCRLCEVNTVYRTRCKGFELAHILAATHGGPKDETNLVATCAECNSRMMSEDMRSWITRTVRDGARRKALLEFVGAPHAVLSV